jgi:GNAT superfamily N-acetyltransferase
VTLSIRLAGPDDVPAMSRVLTASITQLCAADHGNDPVALAAWTANKTEEGVTAMMARQGLRVLVAELDGAIAAVGAADTDGKIGLNYVAPEARFRGVSKALLARLEDELRAMGFVEGRLEATETALRFYQSAGWHSDGPQATGRRVNGYPMRKVLVVTA